MKRVLNFFNSIDGNNLQDVIHNKNNNNPGWKDYVLKSLFILGFVSGVGMAHNAEAAQRLLVDNSVNIESNVLKEFNQSKQAYANAGKSLIRNLYIDGMLSQKYKINILNPDAEDTEAVVIPGVSCQVNWGVDKKGLAQSLISGVDIKQTPLYKKMILLHETSHCELLKIENPFRHSGLKNNTEKWMNEWVVGGVIPKNEVNSFFAENFADTYGFLMLLKTENFSDESVNELKRWYEIRKIKREMDERKGFAVTFDSHYTDFSLKQLVDQLDNLKQLNTSDYKNLALDIASKSTMEWLNLNRDLQPLNQDVSVPTLNATDKRIVGNAGFDTILSKMENNNYFESAVIGQIQLIIAENNGVIKTPKLFANSDNESRKMAKDIMDMMKPSNEVKVQLDKKNNTLSWNFKNEATGLFYINSILTTMDAAGVVDTWKEDNKWNSVKKDIQQTLSRKYSVKVIPSSDLISDKITEKLKNKPFSAEDIEKQKIYKSGNYW